MGRQRYGMSVNGKRIRCTSDDGGFNVRDVFVKVHPSNFLLKVTNEEEAIAVCIEVGMLPTRQGECTTFCDCGAEEIGRRCSPYMLITTAVAVLPWFRSRAPYTWMRPLAAVHMRLLFLLLGSP